MARPTKLTEKLLKSFKEVLEEWQNALLCTDAELILLLNEKLEDKEQIAEDSFKRYKTWSLKDCDNVLSQFCALYKRALIKQKDDLFQRLKSDDKARQRRARIIERKFKAWNLRILQDTNLNANVTAKVVPLPPLNDDGGDTTKT